MKWLFDHPVRVGWACTIGIAVFAVWLGLTPYCENETCQSKFSTLVSSRPNEIGDTLAGFAGALAFVWIIVTVWLQSKELAAQREELKMTRMEMEEQRKATQDMARSMAAQAKLHEGQVKVVEEQGALELLHEYLKGMLRYNEDHGCPPWSFYEANDVGGGTKGEISLKIYFSATGDLENDIRVLSREVQWESSQVIAKHRNGAITHYPTDNSYVQELLQLVNKSLSLQNQLSEAHQAWCAGLELAELQQSLSDLSDDAFWGRF